MSGNASGGVRNLRAMFENKNGDQSTSPPSRGRSPSGSVASTSSRPVSKVRASFVAVERSGEQGQLWGLRKASDVSSMAEVKENETSIMDGSPLSATQTTPEKDDNGSLGNILKGSSFAGTPMKEKPNALDLTQTHESDKPAQKPPANEANKQSKTNGVGARAAEAAKKIQDKAKPASTKPNPKPIETKAPAPVKSDKPSPRTPTSAGVKPRGGVAKIKGVMDSAKKAAEGREATRKAEAEKADAVPKSPAKTNGHKKETVSSPRPTTKPGKLPSAAMAPTAASAAHIQKDPEPVKKSVHSSRAAKLPSAVTAMTAAAAGHDRSVPDPQLKPDSQAKKTASRRSSAVHSSHPRLSTASTQSSLAKKSSRASLADRPKSRSSTNKTDDGFLARMMRPTQSSSQKTHEKAQISSPPRAKPAAPKTKPAPRTSLNEHAHHDHGDPAGDYATSPVSPTRAKHPKPVSAAPKDEPTPKPSSTGHAHHDHVDSAGDYAAPHVTSAAASHATPVSADATEDKSEQPQEAHDPVIEEAPMTVAEAEAPIKDTPDTEPAVQADPDPEPIKVEQTPAPAVQEETTAQETSDALTEAVDPVVEAEPTVEADSAAEAVPAEATATGHTTTDAAESTEPAPAEVEATPEVPTEPAEPEKIGTPEAKTAEIAPQPAEDISAASEEVPAAKVDDETTAPKAEAEADPVAV